MKKMRAGFLALILGVSALSTSASEMPVDNEVLIDFI